MILENNLPVVEKVEYVSIKKMKRLLVIVSQMVPFTPNMTKVGESVEATRQSAVRMFQILERETGFPFGCLVSYIKNHPPFFT